MTTSAAQADVFYRETLEAGEVWTLRDAGGFPAPQGDAGIRAMPFWSRRSRAERVAAQVDAYAGFEAASVPLDEWRERWLPGLAADGLLVGLNWSGDRASGYDVPPEDVEGALAARLNRL